MNEYFEPNIERNVLILVFIVAGITAVCSAEVLDIMCSDFSEKYEELRKHMREKQMKELSFKQKGRKFIRTNNLKK